MIASPKEAKRFSHPSCLVSSYSISEGNSSVKVVSFLMVLIVFLSESSLANHT